jgi:hypothetical protein
MSTFGYLKVFPGAGIGYCDVYPRLGYQNAHRLDVGSVSCGFIQIIRSLGDEQLQTKLIFAQLKKL